MDTFEVNGAIVRLCVNVYKSNPRQLMQVFRSQKTTQAFVRETYIKNSLDPQLSLMATSGVVCLSGSSAIFAKIPTTYVMHIKLPDWAEILILFDKGYSLCELAYRLDESMEYFTVLPKGRISMKQEDINAFNGRPTDYVDYTFASKYVKLLKPKRMSIFQMHNQKEVDELLLG